LNGDSSPRHEAAGGSLTVLLVEDDVLTRLATADYLRLGGIRVIEAADVMEAIGVFASGIRVDGVFSDINMPGGRDGHSLARWLARHHPRIPLLLTSGSAEELARAEVGAGRRAIAKPYSLPEVEAIIAAMLG
jgi:CheY-like chemotaxis protein